jgi:hypothetical protein
LFLESTCFTSTRGLLILNAALSGRTRGHSSIAPLVALS